MNKEIGRIIREGKAYKKKVAREYLKRLYEWCLEYLKQNK